LDSSIAIGGVIIFFCLEFPRNGTIGANSIQSWWGNTVYQNTADWMGTPYKTVQQGEVFGPLSW
jgi:hypothetical protein